MDLTSFLTRARSALAVPSFYWLGSGGWTEGQPPTEWPSTPLDIDAALEEKRIKSPRVYQKYLEGERASGIHRSTLPPVACDCSGYVCWALGIARDSRPGPDKWFNTDGMIADALGARQRFVPAGAAVPGALLVHARLAGDIPGHVGIVTEVDAAGRAKRMLHCSAVNYLIQPPAGGARNAIAETDTRYFDDKQTHFVMWKGFLQPQ